jgi:hypothetical protein
MKVGGLERSRDVGWVVVRFVDETLPEVKEFGNTRRRNRWGTRHVGSGKPARVSRVSSAHVHSTLHSMMLCTIN